jgi:hypothetical protein
MAYTVLNTKTNRWEVGSTKLTDSHIKVEKDELGYIIYPTGLVEQIQAEADKQRVQDIKAKAEQLILETYPMYKQNNVLMSGVQVDIDTMNSFISNIRNISNEAEANGTELLDIVW